MVGVLCIGVGCRVNVEVEVKVNGKGSNLSSFKCNSRFHWLGFF